MSSYTYAYTFFLLPYGVVAVSVMTAVTPSLSARWATGDLAAFRHRMAFGLRGILAIIIPSAVGMLILAHPLIDLVLAHGAETSANADSTGRDPGHVRPRAARLLHLPLHGARLPVHAGHPHRLPAVPGGERPQHRVRRWPWSDRSGSGAWPSRLSIAYSVAALLALAVVRNRVGGLGGPDLTTPVKRVLGASGVMAVATVLALSVSGATSGVGLLARVVFAVVVGVVAYVATAGLLGARAARRVARSGPGAASHDARHPRPEDDPRTRRRRASRGPDPPVGSSPRAVPWQTRRVSPTGYRTDTSGR